MKQDANTPGFIQIGRVNRAHGLEGEITITFEDGFTDSVEDLELVYLQNERGDFYPARISEVRAEEKRSYNSFFVQFEHIADKNSAEQLKGRGIFLDEKTAAGFINTEYPAEDELVDYEVIDENNNSVGLVVEVMDNPAHPILVVATTSGSLLIPFVEHYVTEVSDKNIYCQNLEQLEGL